MAEEKKAKKSSKPKHLAKPKNKEQKEKEKREKQEKLQQEKIEKQEQIQQEKQEKQEKLQQEKQEKQEKLQQEKQEKQEKLQQERAKQEKEEAGRFSSETFGWLESMLFVLVAFIIVFTFIVRVIGVDGESMLPTLQNGDIMLVSNLGYKPARGDVVVLKKDGFYGNKPIVKRVIAVGGDELNIDSMTGEVSVNGQVLDEPYIKEMIDPNSMLGDFSYPINIPEGSIFVMGDNRNNSLDSRRAELGVVDERYVIGHVLSVVFPFDNFGAVNK